MIPNLQMTTKLVENPSLNILETNDDRADRGLVKILNDNIYNFFK